MSLVKSLNRDLGLFQISIENWTIADQGITVLWGPSGSGKSTILHALLGFDPLSKLSWIMDGQDLGQKPTSERRLGAVMQNLALFPHMTAEENILFPVAGRRAEEWRADYDELVRVMNLSRCLHTPAPQLSGGEAQRVALARALIYRPRMLLLDEPFSALDSQLRQEMRDLLRKVSRDRNCPILLVTHDEEDRRQLADQVVHLDHGKIRIESL